jgi:tRNA modification GTPase
LLGEARALVTPVAGTTRDAIEAVIDGRRWPLRLVDTAGLRQTNDLVERLGIEVSERYLTRAEAVLACGERPDDVASTASLVAAMTDAPVIRVLTKIDRPGSTSDEPTNAIATSAETGAGLTAVLTAIEDVISARHGQPALDAPVLTRARHVAALRQAAEELARFMETWATGALPAPVAAVHLRAAVGALEELVGAVDVEDVLDRVFRTFCVGK